MFFFNDLSNLGNLALMRASAVHALSFLVVWAVVAGFWSGCALLRCMRSRFYSFGRSWREFGPDLIARLHCVVEMVFTKNYTNATAA